MKNPSATRIWKEYDEQERITQEEYDDMIADISEHYDKQQFTIMFNDEYPEDFFGTFPEAQAYARKVVRGNNAIVTATIIISEEV